MLGLIRGLLSTSMFTGILAPALPAPLDTAVGIMDARYGKQSATGHISNLQEVYFADALANIESAQPLTLDNNGLPVLSVSGGDPAIVDTTAISATTVVTQTAIPNLDLIWTPSKPCVGQPMVITVTNSGEVDVNNLRLLISRSHSDDTQTWDWPDLEIGYSVTATGKLRAQQSYQAFLFGTLATGPLWISRDWIETSPPEDCLPGAYMVYLPIVSR